MLDKAIAHGKERRREYRGGKRWSMGCRNHGSCLWCQDNRRHFDTRRRMAADYDLNNWKEEIA